MFVRVTWQILVKNVAEPGSGDVNNAPVCQCLVKEDAITVLRTVGIGEFGVVQHATWMRDTAQQVSLSVSVSVCLSVCLSMSCYVSVIPSLCITCTCWLTSQTYITYLLASTIQYNNTESVFPPTNDWWPRTMLVCAKGMLTKIKKI